MAARQVEIFLDESEAERIEQTLARHSRNYWRETVPGEVEKWNCIVQQRYVERLLRELDENFGSTPGFMAHVTRLEATLPAIIENEQSELLVPGRLRPPTRLERFFSRDRVSTDELYEDLEDRLKITPSFILTVTLSAIIAALGMRSGQTAVVIGAMIIAPLLGPTMGLAMSTTVGDLVRGRRAATTLLTGSIIAIICGYAVGMTFSIDPNVPELRDRAAVLPADIALALASGAAGVLAFSRAASASLVGVMIAVALVPPLAACGVFAAIGYLNLAGNALFLFAVNLVCLNVAGILMFLLEGLPPKSWRLTAGLLSGWTMLLLILALMAAGRLAFGVGVLENLG